MHNVHNTLAMTTQSLTLPSSASVKQLAIAAAFTKMAKGGHFSICTVKDAAKVAGVTLAPDTASLFALLHCVDWTDIAPPVVEHISQFFAACIAAAA